MNIICENKECNKKTYCRSVCRAHYLRMMRNGAKRLRIKGLYIICSVEKCNNKHSCKSYCNKHYLQVKKYGRVQTKADMAVRYAVMARGLHPNKGKKVKWSRSHIAAIKKSNTGRRPWNKIGDGITSQNKLERAEFLRTMQPLVLARDNYTCQTCDQYNGYLHVDHIKGWADYPELRFDMDNCRTLCRACHYYVTFKRTLPITSTWGIVKKERIAF